MTVSKISSLTFSRTTLLQHLTVSITKFLILILPKTTHFVKVLANWHSKISTTWACKKCQALSLRSQQVARSWMTTTISSWRNSPTICLERQKKTSKVDLMKAKPSVLWQGLPDKINRTNKTMNLNVTQTKKMSTIILWTTCRMKIWMEHRATILLMKTT